jgi:ribonucleoside-diphosphate reductase subunit M2
MTNSSPQAASAIESFKMESPVKMQKLATEENKENLEARYEADEVAVPIKGIPELPEEPEQPTAASVAPTIRDDEKAEPILQENPQRFVLFPIKYHEVSAEFTLRDFTR